MKKKLLILVLILQMLSLGCTSDGSNEQENMDFYTPTITTVTTSERIVEPAEPSTPEEVPEPQKPTAYLDIPLSQELQNYTLEQCNYDIDLFCLVMAIMQQESNFEPDSIGIDGHDLGLMQIRDCNIGHLEERFGSIDLMDAYDNIKCGAYMIGQHLDKYEHINLALMAYNCGETGARRLWEKGVYSTDYSIKVTEYYKSFKACM